MKRIISVLLAAVMVFSMAACAKNDEEQLNNNKYEYTTGYDETKYNAPGEFPIFKEKQTITVMLPDSPYVEDWETNYQTVTTEEALNCDLVMNEFPSKEYKTKLNLMVAAGGDELSDAILGAFSDATVINYADAGAIAPLTDYFFNTDVSYYIHEGIERLGWNYFNEIIMPDGGIYYIPRVNESISNANPDKMWMYIPWLEKLGIDFESIETRDDFRDALKAIVTGDPNGNGKQDEIGLVGYNTVDSWFCFIMNTFVYAGDSDFFDVNDGKVSFAFTSDKWKEGLKYMKDMYDEGLISPLIFSQDSASFKSTVNAETTVAGAFCQSGPGSIDQNDPRRVQYEGIKPLLSDANDGKPLATYSPTTADARFLVNAKAADVENTFRFGDFMTCERISINQGYGREGVDWFRASPDDHGIFESLGYPPTMVAGLAWSTLQNSHWFGTGPYVRQRSISGGLVFSGNPLDHNGVIGEAQLRYEGHNPEEYITKLIYTEEENDIVGESLKGLTDYVDEMSAKFITGAEDIDSGWDDFQKQLEKLGLSRILECSQAAYERINAQ